MEANARQGGNYCERVGYNKIHEGCSKVNFSLLQWRQIPPLFNVTLDIEEHNEIEMEIDQVEATLTVMEECL